MVVSTIDHQLDFCYEEFENHFGFGPCGAYAALRREQGWGQVAVCLADSGDGYKFTHYVIWDDGDIIDMANPLGITLKYSELEILGNEEMPELCEDWEAVNWLKDRFE